MKAWERMFSNAIGKLVIMAALTVMMAAPMVTLASGACGQPVQWSVVGDIHGKRSTKRQEPLRCVTQGAGGTSEAIELGLRDWR